jgi:hypothetical protein
MKFCPVVPEICRGQVHVPRKERKKEEEEEDVYLLGLSLLSSVSKHNMWLYYDWGCHCCRPSVNTICGCIMIGLSLLSSVSKHNMWLHYDWVVVR